MIKILWGERAPVPPGSAAYGHDYKTAKKEIDEEKKRELYISK